jgi:2'-5' RNA ligase
MNDEAMIAFLPEDGRWCKQDLPHMTLVYCGSIEDLQSTDLNAMTKDAISAARVTGPFSLPVTAVEEWGVNEKVDVLVLYPTPQLLVARSLVKHWNKSEFTEFKPHATIGPAGSAFAAKVEYGSPYESYRDPEYRRGDSGVLPDRLYFNRIAVCWGEKKLVFNTNSF